MCFTKKSTVINSIYSGQEFFSYMLVYQWSHDPKFEGSNLAASYTGEKETILIIKFSLKPLTP
jgi:hypothetical protein